MTRGPNFMALAGEVAKRRGSARHQRRAAEAEARAHAGKSVPAMKKIIRRNRQRQK